MLLGKIIHQIMVFPLLFFSYYVFARAEAAWHPSRAVSGTSRGKSGSPSGILVVGK